MGKIGRNERCPCGSGKKYKKCHGNGQLATPNNYASPPAALEAQRRHQQGEGRPIITAEAFGRRFVAIKGRLLQLKGNSTVPDFLGGYIRSAMGADWGKAELAKPPEKRHPILVWYQHLCEQQRLAKQAGGGETFSTPKTGGIAAYLHLAYDLFTLEHNAEARERLIDRLRLTEGFEGAQYEVFVAAALIRAGFEIEFEDEDDGSRTHCEYTATFKQTGRKFSVEAKCQTGNEFRIGRQFNRAREKQADHERIIFIEINAPDDGTQEGIPLLMRALKMIRRFEGKPYKGVPSPNAYVVVTNTPRHHHMEAERFRCSAAAEGFQIPDFKFDSEFPNLRAAIDARERHFEMHSLMKSLREHSELPPTFDGEIPEFAFKDGPPRLIIGNRYAIPDEDGVVQAGLLTTATVSEKGQVAYCGLTFPNGKSGIFTWPLTDAEMAAWRQYPDTFFGVVGQSGTKAKDPLELYDFFLRSYSQTPKERLLEFFTGAPDFTELEKMDQAALASVYAERCAMAAFSQNRR